MTSSPQSAVVGIDVGASESLVAYLGKGVVDLVQNEVSRRATPSLVGFTHRERLLGDAALAQIRSNAKNSCRNFKHLLGRSVSASDLEKEHFWSTAKLATATDEIAGYDVQFRGEGEIISAVQCMAMFLTRLQEITEKWCQAKVAHAVIAVPSYFSDEQRHAVLDAARIADVSVLRLINEHTATALSYGIYRSNDFDQEKPTTVAFCSMGHSIFSVSIVQFIRNKMSVLCEKSDTVGGRDMDECLMRAFAEQFKGKHGCDPLTTKKSAFKLEDAVTKTKKVLSANSEAPVTVECLMEDEDFASNMNRADFERMCQPMMDRVKAVLEGAKAMCSVPVEEIHSVEVVGGASRVPWFKRMCSEAFGGRELATTMNADESVARGCALQAAILSPLFKVREPEFIVEDFSCHAVSLHWASASALASKGNVTLDKSAIVFPAGSKMDATTLLTFQRSGPFDVKAQYADDADLLPGTRRELGTYRIDLPVQSETKKVKLWAKITMNGTFTIESAQMLEEEEYEELVKEQRELPPAEQEEAKPKEEAADAAKTEDAAAAAEAEPKDKEVARKSPADYRRGQQIRKKSDLLPKPAGLMAWACRRRGTPNSELPKPIYTIVDIKASGEKMQYIVKDEHGKESAIEPDDVELEPEDVQSVEEQQLDPEEEPVKKYEWVEVMKKKKRIKRTDVAVSVTGTPGLPADVVKRFMDEEAKTQADMQDIIETDEKRNDLEGYIFDIRDKISESGAYGAYISEKDREKFNSDLMKSEDWLMDNPDATKQEYVEKLDELKETGDVVVSRVKDEANRTEWLASVNSTIAQYRATARNPGWKFSHISSDKIAKIHTACNDLEKWLGDKEQAQAALPKYEKPAFTLADLEKKSQELCKTADNILKEPKPSPKPVPKAEKKEEKKEEKKDDKKDDKKEDKKDEKSEPKKDSKKEEKKEEKKSDKKDDKKSDKKDSKKDDKKAEKKEEKKDGSKAEQKDESNLQQGEEKYVEKHEEKDAEPAAAVEADDSIPDGDEQDGPKNLDID